MTRYFAYGSNCNLDVMGKKGVGYTSRVRARLKGFRLRFNKKSLRPACPMKRRIRLRSTSFDHELADRDTTQTREERHATGHASANRR